MFSPMALQQMWERAWPIISVLLGCSVLSGAIILERWVTLTRAAFNRESLMNKLRKMLMENHLEQAVDYCGNLRKPVGRVLHAVLEFIQQNRSTERERVDRLSGRMIRGEMSGLSRNLTVLGTIGSVSPFVGLFGTVVGIIHAFRAISENAGGGPGVVANGIAEALITTALGLFVAIPAVVCYNLYIRKIEQISDDMQLSTDEVVDMMHLR
jgi:biopolymer transport protein ExbB/TolQ